MPKFASRQDKFNIKHFHKIKVKANSAEKYLKKQHVKAFLDIFAA